jgi:hypothetical protein
MSVICDKDNGHFSLIPNTDNAPDMRRWYAMDSFNLPHLLDALPPPPAVPESIEEKICALNVVAFPLAAAMFQFHDFVIRAAGLPYDMDPSDEETKKKIGAASNVVYEHSGELPNTYDISCALDALHRSGMNVNSVSNSDLDLLRTTMDELLSIDGVDEDDMNALIGGMGVIDDHFKEVS